MKIEDEVAKAIWKEDTRFHNPGPWTWDAVGGLTLDHYQRLARVALKVISDQQKLKATDT